MGRGKVVHPAMSSLFRKLKYETDRKNSTFQLIFLPSLADKKLNKGQIHTKRNDYEKMLTHTHSSPPTTDCSYCMHTGTNGKRQTLTFSFNCFTTTSSFEKTTTLMILSRSQLCFLVQLVCVEIL